MTHSFHPGTPLTRLGRSGASLLAALALLTASLGTSPALAQHASAVARQHRIAQDLHAEAYRSGPPRARWARDVNGVRHVQAIVVSNSKDPELTDLRKFVLKSGGSVLVRHAGINALTVMVKASTLQALAQHKDVQSVSPNRSTARTASSLELITGAATASWAGGVRTFSNRNNYNGYDGSGIGIAVLDSGVMKAHDAFLGGSGSGRVKKSVNMLASTQSLWAAGLDSSTAALQPGSSALQAYEDSTAMPMPLPS